MAIGIDEKVETKVIESGSFIDKNIIYKINEFKLSNNKVLRQLEIILKESDTGVIFEMDEIEFYEGNIQIEKINTMYKIGDMVIPQELTQWNRYKFTGTGTIFTYLTEDNFLINKMGQNTSLVIENGVFCSCEGSYRDVKMSFNLATKSRYNTLYDLKTNIQTYIKGYGLLILRVPFTKGDIRQISLSNSRMEMDFRSVVMRTSAIKIDGISEVISDGEIKGLKLSGSGAIIYCSLLGEVVKSRDVGQYSVKKLFKPKPLQENLEDDKKNTKDIPLKLKGISALNIRPK